jgi:trehalose 6-phosphate synthase
MVEERRLKDWRPKRLIVRIDRTDPSKNIVRGFLAYEKLLIQRPELRGQVQFWAFLQPSRQDVAAYRTYLRRVRQVVARINSQFGGSGWMPIRLEFGENIRKAMAALRNFDVLLVNPVYDGLNLVVKEGAVVNRTDGMIVLSENAGAHEELQPQVLSINPFDIEATADAIYQGLTMSAQERKKRPATRCAQMTSRAGSRARCRTSATWWPFPGSEPADQLRVLGATPAFTFLDLPSVSKEEVCHGAQRNQCRT